MPCRSCWPQPTTTPYDIVQKSEEYEVRQYGPQVRATITPTGGRSAFKALAGYLFEESAPVPAGDKLTDTPSDVTHAVATDPPTASHSSRWCSKQATGNGASIGMALPVVKQDRSWFFVLPGSKTRTADLPQPPSTDIKLVEVPEKQYAVAGFSWWPRDGYVKRQEQTLREAAARDGVKLSPNAQDVEVWLYSRPWTLPWSRRNEVAIPIAVHV